MHCFPESNPNVERSEAGAHAADKTIFKETTESGMRNQDEVIRPLWSPWQNHQ
jgi:hypothetical protein